jgi:hypothetical protein
LETREEELNYVFSLGTSLKPPKGRVPSKISIPNLAAYMNVTDEKQDQFK